MEDKVTPLSPRIAAAALSVEPVPNVPFEQTEQFQTVLSAAHEYLLNHVEDQRVDIDSWSPETIGKFVRTQTAAFVKEWKIPVNAYEMEAVASALQKELTGFGPLDDLLHDPEIEDILINGYKDVHVSAGGMLRRSTQRFGDDRHLLRILRRIIAPLGRRLDDSNPMVDARLPNGGRLNAIISPLAVDGPMVSIRKFRKDPFTPDELLGRGAFDKPMYALLNAMVRGRCNILISGGTSSGKTSLLNALATFIPHNERVITVEDTAELALNHPHVVRLESRMGGFDGSGAVSIRELVRNSLRMRPDRIVVGEVRGAEVLEMLQAMNTGHDGSMATVHANNARDCLYRLEMLAGFAGFQGSEDSLRRQIAGAIDFIVQISRLGSGRRVIVSITEITGVSDNVITSQELFKHEAWIDQESRERDRWIGLGFHPHCHKLEAFRQELREANMGEFPFMMLPLLLGSFAVLLVALAMALWWGLATRVQQRAAASHADTRLSQPDPQRAADEARNARPPSKRWAELLRRAGLKDSVRTLILIALPGIAVTIGAGLRLGSAWFGAFVLALYLLGVALWLYRRIDKIQQRLVAQMPDFLENMVRMAGIGNSLSMAFQSATQNVDPPLRPILDNALTYTRAGMDLDRALQHAAQAYRLRPLEMLAVILGTSIRIGGRSDQILQRMSDFMRDLEEVQRELQATTSETRMSAWVLALLPVGAALSMALMSPDFFQPMFHEPLGKKILLIAVLLELCGGFLLYRLAKSL